MESFEEHDIKVDSNFLNKKGLCGLRNVGNTCFMNTIIQCLSNTLPLLEYMIEKKYQNHLDMDSDDDKCEIVNQWYIMLRYLWSKNAVYAPENFVSVVQNLARSKDYPEFTGYRQSDSQDFLQFFLETMHNALSYEVKMEITGKTMNDFDKIAYEAYTNFMNFFKNDYSKIIDIFYGQFFTICKTEKNGKKETSRSFEPFNMLLLEIKENKKGKTSLYNCLNNYTKKELIDTGDKLEVKYKEVKFWSLPNILIIMFKRYDNNLNKLDTHISFPIENLDMSKYVNGYNRSSYVYDLYAIANHDSFGGGVGSGHYWASVKNHDNNWYKYNDSIVSTLNIKDLETNNAYCLFYRKR
tara:strand:- start:1703 stop:2761 length:1059 start_codon:yes stop_codon:yes gene_type:complete